MDGVGMIAQERLRQVTSEGWTAEHDDEHRNDEIALAAVCYATPEDKRFQVMAMWPWYPSWWKPTPDDRVHELVIAGALIAAEIDRLRRAATNSN